MFVIQVCFALVDNNGKTVITLYIYGDASSLFSGVEINEKYAELSTSNCVCAQKRCIFVAFN